MQRYQLSKIHEDSTLQELFWGFGGSTPQANLSLVPEVCTASPYNAIYPMTSDLAKPNFVEKRRQQVDHTTPMPRNNPTVIMETPQYHPTLIFSSWGLSWPPRSPFALEQPWAPRPRHPHPCLSSPCACAYSFRGIGGSRGI